MTEKVQYNTVCVFDFGPRYLPLILAGETQAAPEGPMGGIVH
jgi:hypothetical protein